MTFSFYHHNNKSIYNDSLQYSLSKIHLYLYFKYSVMRAYVKNKFYERGS